MNNFFSELNKEQLDGLVKLCFYLTKEVFAFLLIPSFIVPENTFVSISNDLSCTYCRPCIYLDCFVIIKSEREDE